MNEIFLTSDLHLNHQQSFLYEPRGFSSIEEMNEAIVERWNSVVKADDLIYNLGDIAMNDVESAISYLTRLNGRQKWIRGNHCTINKIEKILTACPNIQLLSTPDTSYATLLKSNKWNFYLSHYPTKVGNYDDTKYYKIWCLCGHTHTQDKFFDVKDNCYHVEMDAHNCYPVNIEQIKEDIKQYNEEHEC